MKRRWKEENWNEELIWACHHGDTARAQHALKQGATAYDEAFRTACAARHTELAQIMADKGNIREWNLLLLEACEEGFGGLAEFVLSKGATRLNDGLHRACRGGRMDMAQFMAERGAKDWDGALCVACEYGHLDLVEWSIDRGARDLAGGLKQACRNGHQLIALRLLQRGASPDGRLSMDSTLEVQFMLWRENPMLFTTDVTDRWSITALVQRGMQPSGFENPEASRQACGMWAAEHQCLFPAGFPLSILEHVLVPYL